VAPKTSKSGSKKKSAAKTGTKRSKSTSSAASKTIKRSSSPFYVLVIMGLATALVLMVNRYGLKHEQKVEPPRKEPGTSEKIGREREDPTKRREVAPDETKKTEKTDKIKKTDKIGTTVKPDTRQQKKEAVKHETEEVRIYLVEFNEKSEKMKLKPVGRKVSRGAVLENTMRELIKGPTATEKKKGMLTAVPPGLRVNGVTIRNNVAEIDFSGAIEQGAGGSILINRIDQIVYTATQFPNVGSVVIKINGRTRQTLGTDGLSIGGPLHRRQ
jgi:spore germination protein GerM